MRVTEEILRIVEMEDRYIRNDGRQIYIYIYTNGKSRLTSLVWGSLRLAPIIFHWNRVVLPLIHVDSRFREPNIDTGWARLGMSIGHVITRMGHMVGIGHVAIPTITLNMWVRLL